VRALQEALALANVRRSHAPQCRLGLPARPQQNSAAPSPKSGSAVCLPSFKENTRLRSAPRMPQISSGVNESLRSGRMPKVFPLGRSAHFNFRGRRSLSQFQRQLVSTPDSDWPPRLNETFKVLTIRLSLPREKALLLIIRSFEPALRCVKAQNQLLNRIERTNAREKLQRICLRV
jgi:hypothetical protein